MFYYQFLRQEDLKLLLAETNIYKLKCNIEEN